MIFKINLAACLAFILGSLGILIYGSNPATFAPGDLLIISIFGSPTLLWVAGAWLARRRRGSAIVWLLASIFLMGVELFALSLDAEQAREEAITKQYTQQLGGFLAMLLQWAVGLPLLALLALLGLVNQRGSKTWT